MSGLEAAPGELSRFVDALFRYADEGSYASLRAFRDDAEGVWSPPGGWPAYAINGVGLSPLVDLAASFATRCARARERVVFAPPVGTFKTADKATGDNLANGLALSVECDAHPDAARRKLESLLGPATVVVASGGEWTDPATGEVQAKLHLHWRLSEPTRAMAEHARLRDARALACDLVGADASNKAIVHPIRWPGSWHRKKAPRLARIVSLVEAEVELDDVLERLREAVQAAGKRDTSTAERSSGEPQADPLDVAAALAAMPNTNLDWNAWNRIGMATWRATAGRGFAAFDAWSQQSGKYDPVAIRARWDHYSASPPTLIGAGTLFQEAAKARPGWRKPSSFTLRNGREPAEQADDGGKAAAHSTAEGREPDAIKIVAGRLPYIVNEAEQAFIRAGLGVYQRGGLIVRPGIVPIEIRDRAEVAGTRLIAVKSHTMAELLTSAATWLRFDGRSKEWVRTDCRMRIAETYLARAGHCRLPVLASLIACPTLRPDGSVLDSPGYDRATGLLFDPQGVYFPAIPKAPGRQLALEALETVKELIGGFPFVSDADRSVALSGILTAVLRPSLPSAPLHGFSAPMAGTGKSMLVDIASLIVSGRQAAVISQGSTAEEMEKRLGACLIACDPLISIDNCEAGLSGDLLCQALTQPNLKIRLLGQSRNVETPTTAAFFATGNNLVLVGDLSRRAIVGKLDPGVERPELRIFTSNPVATVAAHRGRYVAAALTMLRAHRLSGADPLTTPLGSFEEWSRRVRDALVWLGEADPCLTMEDVRMEDPRLAALTAVINQWATAFGDRRVSAAEIVKKANEHDGSGYVWDDLRNALMAVAADRGTISVTRLGSWLRKHKGRLVGARRIAAAGVLAGTNLWALESA